MDQLTEKFVSVCIHISTSPPDVDFAHTVLVATRPGPADEMAGAAQGFDQPHPMPSDCRAVGAWLLSQTLGVEQVDPARGGKTCWRQIRFRWFQRGCVFLLFLSIQGVSPLTGMTLPICRTI